MKALHCFLWTGLAVSSLGIGYLLLDSPAEAPASSPQLTLPPQAFSFFPEATAPTATTPLPTDPITTEWNAEEAEAIQKWTARFDHILKTTKTREEAEAKLIAALDAEYFPWVRAEIHTLTELPLPERYDALDTLELALTEGSSALLDALGLETRLHGAGISQALDLLAAERQYAQVAPTPDTRLGLLQLDREREARHLALIEQGLEADALATAVDLELENWYQEARGKLLEIQPEDEQPIETTATEAMEAPAA